MTPAVVTGCSAGQSAKRCLQKGELVSKLGWDEDPSGDGRVEIRRREVRKTLRRSHSRLVDTVADARAIRTRDDEREIRIDRVVVERPATAGRVRTSLQHRPLDLEVAVLGVRLRDIHDLVVAEV